MDVLCEETDLNGCGSAASMYSLGVKFVGSRAYKFDQRNYCQCPEMWFF